MYVLVKERKDIDGRIHRMFFQKYDWMFCSMTLRIDDAKKYRTKKEALEEMRFLGKTKEYFIGKVDDYVQTV